MKRKTKKAKIYSEYILDFLLVLLFYEAFRLDEALGLARFWGLGIAAEAFWGISNAPPFFPFSAFFLLFCSIMKFRFGSAGSFFGYFDGNL